jgi:carbonic anhydrase
MKQTKHATHTCQAIVVSCMDFRLRTALRKWTKETLKDEGFDRLAIAGGVKNLPFVLDQVELSYKLHAITEVYLINHEDCGAYGAEGTYKKHKEDLSFARKIIKRKFPKLKIYLLYLKLNGKFKPVK